MTDSPALESLRQNPQLNELDAGTPNRAAADQLESAAANLDRLFSPHAIADREMAEACLAGLWLLHDFLDESHRISQNLDNPTGSLWHGIMHRREGDFSNAKYWFCRVGNHPVYVPLGDAARELAAADDDPATAFLRKQTRWDPNPFVDLCQRSLASSSKHNLLCRQLQRKEWELLFEFCFGRAIGRER